MAEVTKTSQTKAPDQSPVETEFDAWCELQQRSGGNDIAAAVGGMLHPLTAASGKPARGR